MRILTVRNPWAWALVHGGKDVENRPRNIAGDYRGLVAIHVAQAADGAAHERASWPELERAMTREIRDDASLQPGDLPWQSHAGHIIGVAELVGNHLAKPSASRGNVCFDDHTPVGEVCSPWAHPAESFVGHRGFHLVLADARPLSEPIPYTGALGLRRLDDATTARVLAGLP